MASAAPVAERPWLPTYGWWPRPEAYSLSVVLSPYHSTTEEGSEFEFTLRGYCGSPQPVWEHAVGRVRHPDQRVVRLADLDIPEPPAPEGGILEVESVRLDRPPSTGRQYIGMWLDAVGVKGGGYLIPTIPIRGAAKSVRRDDIQVVPGILASEEAETEILLLNPLGETIEVRLEASSPEGLVAESRPFEVRPYSAWHGDLSRRIPRLRRLLGASEGLGSLSIHSSSRLLPYFAFRRPGQPVVSMDHTAPIFA